MKSLTNSKINLFHTVTSTLPSTKKKNIHTISTLYQLQSFSSVPKCKSTQSCPTLYDLRDYSPPGYSVHGIFQARYWTRVSCIAGWFFTIWATRESHILQVSNFFQHALSNKQGQSSQSKLWLSSACVVQGRFFLEVHQKRNFTRGTLG